MKTKRIVALALTAAMALSMSMTAFAAQWKDFELSDYDKDSKTTTNYWGIKYKVDGKDPHTYYLQEAEKITATKEDASTGEISYTKDISAATKAAKGDTEAVVPFSKIKDTLEVPANDPQNDYKFYGWSLTPDVKSDKEDDAFKNEKVKDDKNVADLVASAKDGVVTFYPMLLKKSMEEKVKDYEEIAARPKIAKTKDDKDWKYTEQEICAVKSKEKASSDSGKEDCEKCNTTTGKAVVFDVKPVVRESNKDVILRTSKAPKIEVILPITRLLTKDEKTKVASGEEEAKKIVEQLKKDIKENKDNKVKVFHIGSDGKSHPVTNFEIVYAAPTGATEGEGKEVCVKFKYGSFSDFVVTRDKDAKAQAGEEEGASGGNPATGEASALPVAMLALAALSATGVVAYKKRKAE